MNLETTFVPPNVPLTPMLSQYIEVKKRHADSILFYRMGDFYEMFFQDAVEAAPLLEVQLTSRDRNAENPIPMCGVPHHAALTYAQRLLEHGKKVAFCDQVEDAAAAKGLVKREVTRILTPALIADPDLVPDDTRNLLVAICETKTGFEISALDLLESSVKTGQVVSEASLFEAVKELRPKEFLIPAELSQRSILKNLLAAFPSVTLTVRSEYFKSASSLDAVKTYVEETQKRDPASILLSSEPLFDQKNLRLDTTSVRALELIEGTFNPHGPTLFKTIDRTLTAMGRRLLKDRLVHPSSDLDEIEQRLQSVGKLLEEPSLLEFLRKELSEMRDLERLTTKTLLGLAMPRDLVAIREILKRLPAIQEALNTTQTPFLSEIAASLSPLTELVNLLEAALEDLPPATYRDAGILKEAYHPEVKELRSLTRDAKGTIAAMEAREKERTGISSLKIKFSKVFGYTLEVTTSHLSKVPPEYIRKQTIANGERFITEELKTFEEKALTAEGRLKSLEESVFLKIRDQVAAQSRALILNAKKIAELDVIQGFSKGARDLHLVAPKMHSGYDLVIEDGRHPVVESLLPVGKFVPNSVELTHESSRTIVITGPNMAGKSTVMRQTALIALLAHAGSFVPAKSAKIPLLDSVFTRIGSSDDLAGGRSTFMVEMTEIGRILEKATPRSLVIVDEIGRGTSTYDGLALAWSIVEQLHNEVGAKTLFATHFHEITSLEKMLPGLKNANVLVEKWKNEIVFLHKLGKGSCQQSYGIEVAKLANLPPKVLLRAKDILGVLETQSQRANRTRSSALETHEKQMGFFDEVKSLETRARVET